MVNYLLVVSLFFIQIQKICGTKATAIAKKECTCEMSEEVIKKKDKEYKNWKRYLKNQIENRKKKSNYYQIVNQGAILITHLSNTSNIHCTKTEVFH